MKTSTYLHNGWTSRPIAGPIPSHLRDGTVPATVPGSVRTDLGDRQPGGDTRVALGIDPVEGI